MAQGFLPQLVSFELSSDQVTPGSALSASFEFANRGDAPAATEYTVFVHIRNAAGPGLDAAPAAGADFWPATPTFVWMPGGLVAETERPIRLPDDFAPGQYNLLLGLYEPGTGRRIALDNRELSTPDGRYLLGQFTVLPAGQQPEGKALEMRVRDATGLRPNDELLGPEEPGDAILLDSAEARVVLSARRPVVLGYRLPDGSELAGDLSGYPVRVAFGRTDEDGERVLCLRRGADFVVARGANAARYSVSVVDESRVAVSFDVVFRLTGTTLRVGIENVAEQPGYLLYDVWLPQVVAARGPQGQLALPTQAGRLVPLDRARPGQHSIAMNWFEGDLCGAVAGDSCAAAVRTSDWDNLLDASVAPRSGQMTAGFAPRFVLRARASKTAARILLARAPSMEVLLVGTGHSRASWIDAAKRLRRDVVGSPNPVYRDCVIYKIFCDSPGAEDFTTFDEALELIRRVHRLAPWLRQVVYLVGWQYEGHDTGYPATDRINERLGGMEGLRRLSAEARKLNAIVSYHDNFDDAYPSSPQWNESLIARGTRGGLQKGGIWAGGQSYILALGKYAEQAAPQRVKRTLQQMPVSDSYHIDVLSAVPVRRDHNPEAPESTRDSLEAKCAIIRLFNEAGVDVTSEGFSAPFVGVIGHSWHFWQRPDTVIPGDEPIPFLPMIYHGGPTTYGHGGGGATYPQETALLGATYSADWTKTTDPHLMAEMIYLVAVPWTYLREQRIESYGCVGAVKRLTYDDGGFVEVDQESGKWRVVVGDETIVRDDVATVRRPGLLALLSKAGGRVSADLPADLRGKPLQAQNAVTGESMACEVTAEGEVTVELAAREPCLIVAAEE